jgi:hypothetical protein
MAIDYSTVTRSNEKKVTVLQAANSDTSINISDQNIAAFGSNRRSEIMGKIGDTGQTYEKIYGDAIDAL